MKRFYLLDVARGVAAILIVLVHYHYLIFFSDLNSDFSYGKLPFYNFLSFVYLHGAVAVQFFFCLSGFIFFWMYLDKLNQKTLSMKKFFILRFSRLYPLHFLTLVFVALIQYIFFEINGAFSVIAINDLKHFILNIFFISSWGLQDGNSFNAPIWSVSVEVFAYLVFFIFGSLKLGRMHHVFMMLCLSLLFSAINSKFGQVIFCFFVGGGTYLLYKEIIKINKLNVTYSILFGLSVMILFLLFILSKNFAEGTLKSFILWGGLFPSIIMILSLLQTLKPELGKKLSFLGDLTYSMYLLHLPILIFAVGVAQFYDYKFGYSPLFLMGYIIIVMIFSYFSYLKVELPAQSYLRNKLITKDSK